MTAIDFRDAHLKALAAIEEMASEQGLGSLVILDQLVVETPEAWYFPYDSEAFVVRGEISEALAGNLPVRVARDGTSVRFEQPGG
ncbi:hypothetical protein MANY_52930 [Mycolicibacterium anyangense]|uniref:Immunity protein 35 domain-containing protein n=1 Tax=Mycolicibacterium anyangense TaxID=1431246 RepID=A0A6N4WD44_9MYCO|nr:YrhB domain-containing protein [Mycolicibacterium anyangense]BBZ79956.1 hypothetical protein MANY_52930 [Mycolicibacterium anyangense]